MDGDGGFMTRASRSRSSGLVIRLSSQFGVKQSLRQALIPAGLTFLESIIRRCVKAMNLNCCCFSDTQDPQNVNVVSDNMANMSLYGYRCLQYRAFDGPSGVAHLRLWVDALLY
jgi:hypothetical protein